MGTRRSLLFQVTVSHGDVVLDLILGLVHHEVFGFAEGQSGDFLNLDQCLVFELLDLRLDLFGAGLFVCETALTLLDVVGAIVEVLLSIGQTADGPGARLVSSGTRQAGTSSAIKA